MEEFCTGDILTRDINGNLVICDKMSGNIFSWQHQCWRQGTIAPVQLHVAKQQDPISEGFFSKRSTAHERQNIMCAWFSVNYTLNLPSIYSCYLPKLWLLESEWVSAILWLFQLPQENLNEPNQSYTSCHQWLNFKLE